MQQLEALWHMGSVKLPETIQLSPNVTQSQAPIPTMHTCETCHEVNMSGVITADNPDPF
jgi:hypothetical protein